MSDLSHFLMNATRGENTPKLLNTLPEGVPGSESGLFYPTLNELQWDGEVKSREMMTNINLYQNTAINAGEVCAGIMPNNMSGVGTRTLRPEPIDQSQALYCHTGYANGQLQGLAYLDGKPQNVLPILNRVSQMNPLLENPISQPGYFHGIS